MEKFLSLIYKYHSGDKNAALEILNRMDPLVQKYASKIHFMERQDAVQELRLALLQALPHLDIAESEGKCISYITSTVIHQYYALCKYYLSEPKTTDISSYDNTLPAPPAMDDSYFDVEAYINSFPPESPKRKILAMSFYQEQTDGEIAKALKVSRQYVNRIRRELARDYYSKHK